MENCLVISTVGTSLLTHQINRNKENEKTWYSQLQKVTNFKPDEVEKNYPQVVEIIQKLKTRAEEKLEENDTKKIRSISAELNGIYGFYNNELEKGNQDVHWLIATNTAQGIVTAEMIREFLVDQGITNTNIYQSNSKFSTASTDEFSQGIAKIIPWIQEIMEGYKKSQTKVVFNLVGGFKAVQGYMNTIGMFYADEIIYIFEGSNQLIKIPRLPVEIKLSEVEKYKVPLAMMAQGEVLTSWEKAQKVPRNWVYILEKDMTLSTWGQLIYQQCKDKLLSQDKPLKFPKIEYNQSFIDDYQDKNKPADEKIILQENLARLACLLNINKDGISAVKQDGIFRLRRYSGKHKDLDHFDLPKDRRVSCLVSGNTLQLRHYGEHDYVNNNP